MDLSSRGLFSSSEDLAGLFLGLIIHAYLTVLNFVPNNRICSDNIDNSVFHTCQIHDEKDFFRLRVGPSGFFWVQF